MKRAIKRIIILIVCLALMIENDVVFGLAAEVVDSQEEVVEENKIIEIVDTNEKDILNDSDTIVEGITEENEKEVSLEMTELASEEKLNINEQVMVEITCNSSKHSGEVISVPDFSNIVGDNPNYCITKWNDFWNLCIVPKGYKLYTTGGKKYDFFLKDSEGNGSTVPVWRYNSAESGSVWFFYQNRNSVIGTEQENYYWHANVYNDSDGSLFFDAGIIDTDDNNTEDRPTDIVMGKDPLELEEYVGDNFGICVVDSETGKAISKAPVYIDNERYETNEDGLCLFAADNKSRFVYSSVPGYVSSVGSVVCFVPSSLHRIKIDYIYEKKEPEKATGIVYEKQYDKKDINNNVYQAAKNYRNAMNQYVQSLKSEVRNKCKDDNTPLCSYEDIVNKNMINFYYGNKWNTTQKKAIVAAYERYLDDYKDELCRISNVNLKDNEFKISLNIIKQVSAKFSKYDETTHAYGHSVSIRSLSIVDGCGVYSVYMDGGVIGVLTTSPEKTQAAINDYLTNLSQVVNDLERKALLEVLKELAHVTGIDEFIKQDKEVVEDNIRGWTTEKIEALQKIGFGDVLKINKIFVDAYGVTKDICAISSAENLKGVIANKDAAKRIYTTIKDLDYSDSTIRSDIAAGCIDRLEKANKLFAEEMWHYIYDPNYEVDYHSWWARFTAEIFCPVDFEILDEENNMVLAYYKNGEVKSTEEIDIKIYGDKKIVSIMDERKVVFRFLPTEDGKMNLTFEKYDNNGPTGRVLFYDVPLIFGEDYALQLDTSKTKSEMEDYQLVGRGEIIEANDIIEIGENAIVSIDSVVQGEGYISGNEQTYIKGDIVELVATTDDQCSRFEGWYINGDYVEGSEILCFEALEDSNVVAVFEKLPIPDSRYNYTYMGTEYIDDSWAFVYRDVDQDYIEINLIYHENDFEKDSVYIRFISGEDTNYIQKHLENNNGLLRIENVDVGDSEVIKVIDIKGNIICAFSKKEILDELVTDEEIKEKYNSDLDDVHTSPDGIWVDGLDAGGYTYIGKAIKPAFGVYDGDTRLVLNKDYTATYANNINVGTATVTIRGKGNYDSVETTEFEIVAADIKDEAFTADDITIKATASEQKPKPVLKWKGKAVAATNYTYQYFNADENGNPTGEALTAVKAVGRYVIVITAKENGNFTGSRNVNLNLTNSNQKFVSSLSITAIKVQPYTGSAIEPEVIVKNGKTVLTKSTEETAGDYTVEYKNNTAVGTATVIIKGDSDNYVGTKTVTFKITGTPITKATVEGITAAMPYTGKDITFDDIKLYIKASKANPEQIDLVKSKDGETGDYTVTYQKNGVAGIATVVFTGINGYTGVLKKTFKITPFKYDDDNSRIDVSVADSIEYSKGGAKPSVAVTFKDVDGKTVPLKEKKDYTVTYLKNTAVNDCSNERNLPTVKITLKGSYKGVIQKNFKITARDISEVTATAADKVFANKAGAYKSAVKLTDTDGKALAVNKDYVGAVKYSIVKNGEKVELGAKDIVEVEEPEGTLVTVTITAKEGSNYTGETTATYRVTKAAISSAKVVKIEPQIYTGKAITLKTEDITIKTSLLADALEYGTDYEIVHGTYANNINKGTATVLIRGNGNYGGTRKVTFTIKAKGFVWWWRK